MKLSIDRFVQICLALKHVHDRKILHRDLKTQVSEAVVFVANCPKYAFVAFRIFFLPRMELCVYFPALYLLLLTHTRIMCISVYYQVKLGDFGIAKVQSTPLSSFVSWFITRRRTFFFSSFL